MYAFSLMVVASVATVHATLLTKDQLEILEGTPPSHATLESAIKENDPILRLIS